MTSKFIHPRPYDEDVFSSIPLDTIQFAKVLNEPISEEAMEAIKYGCFKWHIN
jgi:hypothetical protein